MSDTLFASSFISAHASRQMLNQERIRAMLASPTVEAAAQILTDCGYAVITGTDDEIIDAERLKTFAQFVKLCAEDDALVACVRAYYDFKTTIKDINVSYSDAEKKLFKIIDEYYPQIRDTCIQKYFKTALDAFKKNQKQPDDLLYKIAHDCKNDFDSLGPLFHWYILKQSEFKVVKTILMGKRFDFSREIIRDNLRGLHERF